MIILKWKGLYEILQLCAKMKPYNCTQEMIIVK